jgi:hypothetical protein
MAAMTGVKAKIAAMLVSNSSVKGRETWWKAGYWAASRYGPLSGVTPRLNRGGAVSFEAMTGKPSVHRWIWKSATLAPTISVDY